MTGEKQIDYGRIGRMLDERVNDKMGAEGVTIGSMWAAFIDFRQEVRATLNETMRELRAEMAAGFKVSHDKQDVTNGRLRWLERVSWSALGGLWVITFIVGVFGAVMMAS